jgi:uncharacterized protein
MKKWMQACVLLGACAPLAPAVDWKALKAQGYVSDFAHAIDPASKAQIENYCAVVEQTTGAQMAFVLIPSLEGEPIEDVANTIFRAWGVGQKGKNEGIMLLLAINDRRNRLEVGYGLEAILPDGYSGSILRAMRPALRQQQYGDALLAAADTIGGTIAKAKNVTLTASLPQPAHPVPPDSPNWPSIVGYGIVILIGLGAFFLRGGSGGGGGFLAGMILGELASGPSGSRGSGGFGGSDSSDGGFGGFGGGDSGGGGASSNW